MSEVRRIAKVILALNILLLLFTLLIYFYQHASLQKCSVRRRILEEGKSSLRYHKPKAELRLKRVASGIILNAPHACVRARTQTSLDMVIIVLSARSNFFQRRLIRETWGSIKSYNDVTVTAVVFMLGHIGDVGEDEMVSKTIELESTAFRDIITGHFVDTYRNLTRKAILAYDWISTYCPTPDIVVKTDDDVMVNTFQLIKTVKQTDLLENDIFYCFVHWEEEPLRQTVPGHEKYYVSYDQIPKGFLFPTHCAGVGYFLRMSLALRLASAMKSEPDLITHEDVYVTGVLPDKLNRALANEPTDREPIKHVQKAEEWYTWHPVNGVRDEALMKLSIEFKFNETNPRKVFQRVFGTTIFYLILDLEHGSMFEQEFRHVWERVLVDTWTEQLN